MDNALFAYLTDSAHRGGCAISFEPEGNVVVIDTDSPNMTRYNAGQTEHEVVSFIEAFKNVKKRKIED